MSERDNRRHQRHRASLIDKKLALYDCLRQWHSEASRTYKPVVASHSSAAWCIRFSASVLRLGLPYAIPSISSTQCRVSSVALPLSLGSDIHNEQIRFNIGNAQKTITGYLVYQRAHLLVNVCERIDRLETRPLLFGRETAWRLYHAWLTVYTRLKGNAKKKNWLDIFISSAGETDLYIFLFIP